MKAKNLGVALLAEALVEYTYSCVEAMEIHYQQCDSIVDLRNKMNQFFIDSAWEFHRNSVKEHDDSA